MSSASDPNAQGRLRAEAARHREKRLTGRMLKLASEREDESIDAQADGVIVEEPCGITAERELRET